ncbi:MAG TPA: hypothetical protein VGO49_18220 [Bradyrhizobium sp.]|jgi:hypothetical protein|nr:hypothetical protein [Bradyrhizobium sp.]
MADALRSIREQASSIAVEGPVSCRRKQKTTQGQEMLTRILQATAILLAGATMLAAQTAYPSRPIIMVVAFNAGGSTDLIARVLAQRSSQ